MGATLVFEEGDGPSIAVEVSEVDAGGPVVRGGLNPRDVVVRASTSFDDAIRAMRQPLASVISSLGELPSGPDEVEVSFGLRLSGELGVIVTKAGAEANFPVTLRWQRGDAAI